MVEGDRDSLAIFTLHSIARFLRKAVFETKFINESVLVCVQGNIVISPTVPTWPGPECGGRIYKNLTRVSGIDGQICPEGNHEAHRVMPNCDQRDRFVNPYLTCMMDSFSCML